MRSVLEGAARRIWSGEAGWLGVAGALVLAPAAGLYRIALANRRRQDRGRATRVDGIPVVSVGNLAVGGTGKTPVSAWLVRRLSEAGERPALVCRGYGQDEIALHARWNPDAPVIADPDRTTGVRRALREGATVAVLDDGFQHRRLERDVDLVLLAAEDPFPGHVLPWGPYREPAEALARAGIIVVTRRVATPETAAALAAEMGRRFPRACVAQLLLAPGAWYDLEGVDAAPPAGPVLAVAGVARPRDFAAIVAQEMGGPVDLLAFADHHAYSAEDARRIRKKAGERLVVTTEKDAVKLSRFTEDLPETRVLGQEIRWEMGMERVVDIVTEAVRSPEGV